VNELRAAEADFDLFGMDIDVNFVVRHFEKQQRRRRDRVRMDVAIGLVKGVENQFVADEPLVHKNVDATVVGALNFRSRSKPGDGERSFFLFGVERRFGDCGAKRRGERRDFD